MQGKGPPVPVVRGEAPASVVPRPSAGPTAGWPQPPAGGAPPPPPAAGAGFRPPRGEHARLALAIVGMAVVALLVGFLVGFLGPLVALVYGLLGLIGVLVVVAAALALFAGFIAFLLTGRRAEPQYEAPATIESLDTKQS